MNLLRQHGNNDILLIKEFKGSRFPRLTIDHDKARNLAFFCLENDWNTNYFTIYYNGKFGSDHTVNKRQKSWIENNHKKLLRIKRELLNENK